MREALFSLRGKARQRAEKRNMSDSALVVTVLFTGGAVFLAIFFSVVISCVRESKANEPPADTSH